MRKTAMRTVTFVLSMLLATPAFAAADCGAQLTQGAMNACADAQYRTADKALNAAYAALLAKVSPAGRGTLQAAQRSWVAYRDAECRFETLGTSDGSVHPFLLSQCLEGLTRDQTERLAAQANCTEGDLSCGNQ